ncbi:hypothetical protein ACOXXX_18315 [Thalassococcus sp. BH17M4-6]|uniref:hypothetical protein n=1 Tax=Thalassococcus sp. BH17M4-6 TaxID=3413148 RepID=UPI003BE7EC76
MPNRLSRPCLAALAALAPLTAAADPLPTVNPTIRNSLCVGSGCLDDEIFAGDEIKLKSNNNRLLFEDNSTSAGLPTGDWRIITNDTVTGGEDYFSIQDVDGNTQPFRVDAGARTDALVVDQTGRIGLGTGLPVEDIHVVTSDTPTIRFEQIGGSFGEQTFDIGGNEIGFFIRDVSVGGSFPFRLLNEAENGTLVIETGGRVGINTDDSVGDVDVQAILDVLGDGLFRGADATVAVRNTSNVAASRELFRMENNGGSYFTLDNTDAGTTWFFNHEQAAPNRFIIADAVADGPEMTLTADGDLTIPGQLFTAGSCAAGCDRVFEPDYPLPTIAEQAAMMRANKHLPNVGPTPEDGPFNITAMTGGMLNELEKAHLYIAELNATVTQQAAAIARLQARLDTLETR